MTVANPTSPAETEVEQVLTWRLRQLRRAGYSPEEATLLAVRLEVDLHRAIELIERHCPPETAVRILL